MRFAALLAALLLGACQSQAVLPKHRAASSPPPSPGSIQAFVPEAERFVEEHRGLRFKEPVRVQYLDDDAFRDRILELQKQDRNNVEREARLLKALGLVEPGVDVVKAEDELLGAGVTGFYDPKTKELVVRGTRATPSVRHTVVHELTHALQDQWFSLKTPDDLDVDADEAFRALAEGDAVRIERQYISTLSTADQQAVRQEGGSGPPPDVPRVLVAELVFPYQIGPRFIDALQGSPVTGGVDGAFKKRPMATMQVLHPDRYLGGIEPKPVATPGADATPTSDGVVGEFRLELMLEKLLGPGGPTAAQLLPALAAWGGDHYVTWDSEGRSCVRARFVALTPDDLAALAAGLAKFAASRPSAQAASDASGVTLTSCS